jgi:hypothetical protein
MDSGLVLRTPRNDGESANPVDSLPLLIRLHTFNDFKEFARAVTVLKPDLVLEPKCRREMLR